MPGPVSASGMKREHTRESFNEARVNDDDGILASMRKEYAAVGNEALGQV